MVHHAVEQIGVIEKTVDCGKWVEYWIDGVYSSMKGGDLYYLVYHLPEIVWGYGTYSEVEEIVKLVPDWPIGAKVKQVPGNIVAVWIPTRKVWLRVKGS